MNRVMIADVRRAVCAHYGVTAAQLYSYDQRPEIARPRMMAMYLARRLCGRSFPLIADLFRRDPSTVHHAVARIEKLSRQDMCVRTDLVLLAFAIRDLSMAEAT